MENQYSTKKLSDYPHITALESQYLIPVVTVDDLTGETNNSVIEFGDLALESNFVSSVNGYSGAVVLGKADIGLGNADNTSDANKPVSTAQSTADNLRLLKSGDTMTGALVVNSSVTVGNGSTGDNILLRGNSFNGMNISTYNSSASGYNIFSAAGGTFASPTATLNNKNLGNFGFRVHNGTAFNGQDSARISAITTQDTSTTHGAAVVFYTSQNGTAFGSGPAEKMRLDNTGYLRLGNSATISSRLTFDAATTPAGGILFGADTDLYRSAADTLTTSDLFVAQNGVFANTTGGVGRIGLTSAGVLEIGTGAATRDVNLYRAGSEYLKTDDKFAAALGLASTNIIMSPESTDSSVIPYYGNDIAYNRLRGGATRVYYDGVLQTGTDANTDNLFTSTSTAFSIGISGISTVVIETDCCRGFSYTTKWGYAANDVWRAKNVTCEIYDSVAGTWLSLGTVTNTTRGEQWFSGAGGSGGANSVTKVRFTFSAFNTAGASNIFRVGTLYALNYASSMGSEFFMTRDGGTVYGDTTLAAGVDIVTNTTTGTKIATATNQKLGLWNATPIVQPTTSVAAATLVTGVGTPLTSTDTFDGYTLPQIVKALRNIGALA